ncbi:hypothetical protein [Arenibacter algicola]|uniref:hypothetical protein n=1 Tax=Arenibacter algicola TaxID=616991 RepID=UPI0004DF2E7E|nr:hypothetical protein [Arenibacter algicola]
MYQTSQIENQVEIASKLHWIILKNMELEINYLKVTNFVASRNLKTYFLKKSSDLKKFTESLKYEVSIAYPQLFPNALAKYTLQWLDPVAILQSTDEATIFELSLYGDRKAVREYENLLNKYLIPYEIYHLIRKHKMWIEVNLIKFTKMEDLYDRNTKY